MPEDLHQLTPHPATVRSLDVAGLRLAALDARPPADVRGTALLLPGYTGSKEDFAPVLGPLADRGWRVLALDLPGQYESPGPDDASAYSLAALSATVLSVAAGLNAPVHLLGHSFGGLVARYAVLAEPTAWASLVLLDSGPSAIAGGRRTRLDALEPLLLEQGIEAVYDAGEVMARADPAYVAPPPALQAFLRERFLATTPASLLGMGAVLRTESDRTAELRATGVPTLVCYGADEDAWPPPIQVDLAERLGAQRIVIADAMHSPAVQNPAAVVDTLHTFWSAHPAAPPR